MQITRFAERLDAAASPQGEGITRRRLGDDLALALAAALVSLAVSAALGFAKFAEPGTDNDSLMRLVQQRDLLAGQGWFDLHQYRMGPHGGFVMHWSRLVDAPIAGLILLLRPMLGEAGAELGAAIAWPTVLLALSLLALLRAARAFGGEAARFPSLVLGATALHFMGIYSPGTLDHHNLQLTLVLAMTAWLVCGQSVQAGLAAGLAAAASMAVGMETMPYVAAAGLAMALLFWLRGAGGAAVPSGFGIGLAAGAALFSIATVRPAEWTSTTCDAFSGGQAGSAVIAGLGLAAACRLAGRRGRSGRLAALAALAAASAAFVLLAYPHCLADPYAGVPPRLREYWLDWVREAQSLASLLAGEPATAAHYYATALIGLVLALVGTFRSGGGRENLAVTILLAAALAVSAWQVRGSIFSLSLAVIPLSAWVGSLRDRAASVPSARATLKMAAAWLVSFNVAWGVAALHLFGGPDHASGTESGSSACRAASDFAGLADLPAGNVLAISNLGASILAFTHHRTLAGPYHRNIEGNLATIDAMIEAPGNGLAILRLHDIAYVAVCPGNAETLALAERAPEGMLARLQRGEPIPWLAPLPQPEGSALQVFAVLGE